MELFFYQNGLMQVKINEQGSTINRFSISETGVGVEWSQLIPQALNDQNVKIQDDQIEIGPFSREDCDDLVSYTVKFNPMRIH